MAVQAQLNFSHEVSHGAALLHLQLVVLPFFYIFWFILLPYLCPGSAPKVPKCRLDVLWVPGLPQGRPRSHSGSIWGSSWDPSGRHRPILNHQNRAQDRPRAAPKLKIVILRMFRACRLSSPRNAQNREKRSGAPPEASGNSIFSQNRRFTKVLASSRLLAISLPNALF